MTTGPLARKALINEIRKLLKMAIKYYEEKDEILDWILEKMEGFESLPSQEADEALLDFKRSLLFFNARHPASHIDRLILDYLNSLENK